MRLRQLKSRLEHRWYLVAATLKERRTFSKRFKTNSFGSALPLTPVVVLGHVVKFRKQPVNLGVHGRHPVVHHRVVLRPQEPCNLFMRQIDNPAKTT